MLAGGGDAHAEALGDEAERLPGGEAPDADGDALADRDGGAEHGVLLGDGGAQLLADGLEGGPRHPERAAELVLGARRAAHPVPPLVVALLDPEPAAAAPAPGRGGRVLVVAVIAAAAVLPGAGRGPLPLDPRRLPFRRQLVLRAPLPRVRHGRNLVTDFFFLKKVKEVVFSNMPRFWPYILKC